MNSRSLSLVFRYVLAAVFIYAAIHKIKDPYSFSQAISYYEFFPSFLINPIAVWLPWIELTAGICLVVGRWVSGSALTVAVLAVAFGLLTGMAILRGLDISCGCFSLGDEQKAVQWTHIAQNALFLAMARQVLISDGAVSSVGKT
jgi:putative oxidoreductase